MRTRSLRRLLLLASAPLLAGCPPTPLFRTAEPTPKGQWQLTGGVSAGQLRDDPQQTKVPTGQVEIGVRRGVTDALDVGARLFFPGLDVNATWRFLHRGAWSIALAPQVSFVRTPTTGATTNSLTLFGAATLPATYRASRAWAFTLGPVVGAGIYWPETGGSARGLWLGAALSAEWRVGERWWLVPEIDASRVASGEVPLKGTFASFGIGVRVGL